MSEAVSSKGRRIDIAALQRIRQAPAHEAEVVRIHPEYLGDHKFKDYIAVVQRAANRPSAPSSPVSSWDIKRSESWEAKRHPDVERDEAAALVKAMKPLKSPEFQAKVQADMQDRMARGADGPSQLTPDALATLLVRVNASDEQRRAAGGVAAVKEAVAAREDEPMTIPGGGTKVKSPGAAKIASVATNIAAGMQAQSAPSSTDAKAAYMASVRAARAKFEAEQLQRIADLGLRSGAGAGQTSYPRAPRGASSTRGPRAAPRAQPQQQASASQSAAPQDSPWVQADQRHRAAEAAHQARQAGAAQPEQAAAGPQPQPARAPDLRAHTRDRILQASSQPFVPGAGNEDYDSAGKAFMRGATPAIKHATTRIQAFLDDKHIDRYPGLKSQKPMLSKQWHDARTRHSEAEGKLVEQKAKRIQIEQGVRDAVEIKREQIKNASLAVYQHYHGVSDDPDAKYRAEAFLATNKHARAQARELTKHYKKELKSAQAHGAQEIRQQTAFINAIAKDTSTLRLLGRLGIVALKTVDAAGYSMLNASDRVGHANRKMDKGVKLVGSLMIDALLGGAAGLVRAPVGAVRGAMGRKPPKPRAGM
jgi:hypothetical protein